MLNDMTSVGLIPASGGDRPLRVGIYARYSTDLQRDSSIADQIRQCKNLASKKGWLVDEKFIRHDSGLSGVTLQTRPGAVGLIKDIETVPGCIDGVVVDDTSRLCRNLADALDIWKILEFHGTFLYFVNQDLCSLKNGQFFHSIIQYGAQDEQFVHKLTQAVLRGQTGRILDHMTHGGRYFGYKSDAVPDPTRRGSITRPAYKGVRLVLDPVEALNVRKIFEWAAQGISIGQIARKCETECFPRHVPSVPWNISRVSDLLHRELYSGRLIWGKTTRIKHPKTGQIVNRKRDRKDWVIVDAPELAIVSQALWDKVQSVIASRNSVKSRLGGVGRAKDSAVYPLSGKLVCGVCSGPIVITTSDSKGERRYRCKNNRYLGSEKCANNLTVSAPVIEATLTEYVAGMASDPGLLNKMTELVYGSLKERDAVQSEDTRKAQASLPQLHDEKRQLDRETRNIVLALREAGPSPVLIAELAQIEARLKAVDEQIGTTSAPTCEVSLPELRAFVGNHLKNLAGILLLDRQAMRQAIHDNFGPIMLSPTVKEGVPAFEMSFAATIAPLVVPQLASNGVLSIGAASL